MLGRAVTGEFCIAGLYSGEFTQTMSFPAICHTGVPKPPENFVDNAPSWSEIAERLKQKQTEVGCWVSTGSHLKALPPAEFALMQALCCLYVLRHDSRRNS